MSLTNYLTSGFAILAMFTALAVMFSKNVFHAALIVIACLLSVAALYVLCGAEFMAVTQILVYAGGILVVMLFGIMLTSRLGDKPMETSNANTAGSAFLFAALAAVLIYAITEYSSRPAGKQWESAMLPEPQSVVYNTGVNLMTEYALVFEISGVLLLVALVGGAVIASSKPETK